VQARSRAIGEAGGQLCSQAAQRSWTGRSGPSRGLSCAVNCSIGAPWLALLHCPFVSIALSDHHAGLGGCFFGALGHRLG